MMDIQQVSCASCGAPIDVPENVNHLNCKYCGAGLVIKRDQEKIISSQIDEVQESLDQVSKDTEASMRRLELQQQLDTARLQLADVRAEMRAIQRMGHRPQTSVNLEALRGKEKELLDHISHLEKELVAVGGEVIPQEQIKTDLPMELYGKRDWTITFILGLLFGIWGGHRYYTGHIVTGVLQFVTFGGFGVWWLIDLYRIGSNKFRDADGFLPANPSTQFGRSCASSLIAFLAISVACVICSAPIQTQLLGITTKQGQYGPLAIAGIVIAFLVGVAVFIYIMDPNSAVWQPIRRIFNKNTPPK